MINKIKGYKLRKIISFTIISLIILLTVVVNISKAENANTNDISTTADNEKSIVKMSAMLAIGKDANGELKENSLFSELNNVLAENQATVEEISAENVFLVTFVKTGRQYKVDLNTGALIGEDTEEPEEPGDQVVPGEIVTGENMTYQKNGTAVRPVGWAIVPGLDDVSQGLVISDVANDTNNQGNQFVWVPVTNFSEFQREHFGTSGQKWWSGTFVTDAPSANNMYEPVANGIANTTEVEKMYKSVKDNGGFYIGRYEAGKNGTDVVVKKNQTVYRGIKWGNSMEDETGGAVEKATNFITNGQTEQGNPTTVKSTLCYGVQWDAVMRWMKDEPNIDDPSKKYVQDSTGMGWYGNNSSTGNSERKTGIDLVGTNGVIKNKVKNIYDMGGNVREWTMEAYNTNLRVTRGGNYSYSGYSYPASDSNNYHFPNDSYSSVGFRPTLYLRV